MPRRPTFTGDNQWLLLSEAQDMESRGGRVEWVRAFGADERLRGD